MFLITSTSTSGDTRKTWQTINELTCCKSNRTIIKEVEYCGQKSENSLEAAEIFNTIFSEICTNLSKDVAEAAVSYSKFLTETDKLFSFCETTPAHVYSLLSKLSRSKATGPDNILAKLLKECHLKQVYFPTIGKMIESPLSTKIRASAMIHPIIVPFRLSLW